MVSLLTPFIQTMCVWTWTAVPTLPEPEPDPLLARGYIGVNITTPVGGEQVVISNVNPDTPASAAGLMVDDVIVKVNGHTIRSQDEVVGLVAVVRPGEVVEMEVRRGESLVKIRITVTVRPIDLPLPRGAPSPFRE